MRIPKELSQQSESFEKEAMTSVEFVKDEASMSEEIADLVQLCGEQ
jgi:hypothetical protein